MNEEDLSQIHGYLLEKVRNKGGKIDAVYHASQLKEENSTMRKPNIGMAFQAKNDFPEIWKEFFLPDSMRTADFSSTHSKENMLTWAMSLYSKKIG